MSILIKGMGMPTAPIILILFPDGHIETEEYNIGARSKAIPVPPHGRLIDADEFLKRAIGTKCFRGDYALMLEELVGESTTIIPAEEGA